MCGRWPAATATRPGLYTLEGRRPSAGIQPKLLPLSRVPRRAEAPGVNVIIAVGIICKAVVTIKRVHIRIHLLRLMVSLTLKLIFCTVTVLQKKRSRACPRLFQLSVSLGTSGPSINYLKWLTAVNKRALRESHG